MKTRATSRMLERLIIPLKELRDGAVRFEESFSDEIGLVEPEYRVSAKNLLHYLSVRQHDIRKLQNDLAVLGLSSLGRMESHVLATLNAVLDTVLGLSDNSTLDIEEVPAPVNMRTGSLLLRDHAVKLFGHKHRGRDVHIMVTMPAEAAEDPLLILKLLEGGMDIMRINCAHDDTTAWLSMIKNLRQAEQKLGVKCKVQIDLGGPKLRTGPIEPLGRVLKFRPTRDPFGRVVTPAQIWITPADRPQEPPPGATAVIQLRWGGPAAAEVGDHIFLKDLRGRNRELHVSYTDGESFMATCDRTGYVTTDEVLSLCRGEKVIARGSAIDLPELIVPISVSRGDQLILIRSDQVGHCEIRDKEGVLEKPARVPCSLDEVFDQIEEGHHVWFDDGKIGCIVISCGQHEIYLKVIHAGPHGSKLRPEKGINLPDTQLELPALTQRDVQDLEVMARHVDLVALSFVREPGDVQQLEDELHRLGAAHAGLILKIESRAAFENLPRLLLQSLHSPPVGVMVARGDLAVELGFERLAEVQEEILWLCEAAHVPVIWATQVLEGLAKKGAPSRAEVTDAAASARAECVMLNKGPHILEALKFLDDVLKRMADHAIKRSARMRRLSVSEMGVDGA